jgi:hypothetical protein
LKEFRVQLFPVRFDIGGDALPQDANTSSFDLTSAMSFGDVGSRRAFPAMSI